MGDSSHLGDTSSGLVGTPTSGVRRHIGVGGARHLPGPRVSARACDAL